MKKLFIGLCLIFLTIFVTMISSTPAFTSDKEGIFEKSCVTLEVKGKLINLPAEKVRIPDEREVFDVIKEIPKEYKIKATKPNYISDIMAVTDPLYHNQWYVSDIKFDKAWVKLKSENRIKVAVIDTGVDKVHPDLQGKILNGYDFLNNISEVNDKHGHGTFVAGIISANSNDIGIKGLYDFTDIIPVKAMDDNGVGTYENVAKGIIYAVDNGAKIINLSIGGYGYSSMTIAGQTFTVIQSGIPSGIPCSTPGTPSNPSPQNGATGVSTNPTLSWASCTNTDSYDVYLGTPSNPPYVGNTTSTSYPESDLSYNTTYYWKIVAKNNCGNSTSGSVWSFMTMPQTTYTLTVTVNPSNAGSVSKNPDKATYVYGDAVQLTANPNPGYTFSSWSGDAPNPPNSTNPIQITIDGNKSVTVNFTPKIENTIYVSKDGSCSGNNPCYSNIQNGIASASAPSAINITQEACNENVILDSAQTIYLEGGWNSTFTTNSGQTTINGSLTIRNGKMIMNKIILQ